MNDTDPTVRPKGLALWSPAFVMTAILMLFMLLLAALALFVPHRAAVGFGIPVVHPADLFYVRVKGDRDLGTALALIGLMALRRPLPLAIFVAAAIVEPLCDCLFVLTDAKVSVAYALSVHGGATVYGVVLSLLLFRAHARARSRRAQPAARAAAANR